MGIALSKDVIGVIDEYMNHGKPVFKGYESFSFEYLINLVETWWNDNFPIKGYFSIKREHEERYKKYMARSNWYISESYVRLRRCTGAINYHTYCNSVSYFCHDQGNTIGRYIKEQFQTLENAIKSTETIVELWNGFEFWFDEKRKKFMENMESDIAKANQVTKRKTPQSHGGVANLLKVLTKTMQTQGADIRSIAKVQYAVCTQAGIYIPDEFVRDVAVSLDIEEMVVQHGENK